MNVKTKIKNDLWHINYIIPFTAKYLQGGKLSYIKNSIPVVAKLKVVKGDGKRDISKDVAALLECVDINPISDNYFFYSLDEHRTIAVRGNIMSNFTLDYDRAVHGSFNDLVKKAAAQKDDYGKCALIVGKGVTKYRDRVIEYLKSSGNNPELLPVFENLLEKPAEHFAEGLQRILFFSQLLWQTRHGLVGLGRLDKILGDLYQKDIDAGTITKEQALDLACDFLHALHAWYSYKSSALLGDIGQIIILGGTEEDGSYFCNELTEIWLRAQAKVNYPDPKTFLRISSKTPGKLLSIAVECLASKTGSPLFSNDDVVIPRLLDFGFSKAEAYNYCVSACWEPYIPGRCFDQNNIRTFDFFDVLDKCLDTDATRLDTYEKLIAAYEAKLDEEWRSFAQALDEFIWAKDPLVSLFMDGCAEKRKDVSKGGCVHNNYGITTVGMASVCNSLLNLKKLVYDEKRYTLDEINQARKANYKGQDELFVQLQNMSDAFGHDDQLGTEAIELVNKFVAVSTDALKDYKNPFGGCVKFGLSSPNYIKNGKKAPADFSGRKNSDAYSTHISCLDAPYTELVNFAAALKYDGRCFNGNVIDFFMSPSLFTDSRDVFVTFLQAATQEGFFQMQMNIMDSKTLIDAKAHPEKYPGLIVRVWGFSAYFNDLPESYKDVLIERAIKNEAAKIA